MNEYDYLHQGLVVDILQSEVMVSQLSIALQLPQH